MIRKPSLLVNSVSHEQKLIDPSIGSARALLPEVSGTHFASSEVPLPLVPFGFHLCPRKLEVVREVTSLDKPSAPMATRFTP